MNITGSILSGSVTVSAKNTVLSQSFTNNSGFPVEFNNLHSTSVGGVFMNGGDWSISANLQIERGQLDVNNTASFTLLSNATNTSQILPSAELCFVGDSVSYTHLTLPTKA